MLNLPLRHWSIQFLDLRPPFSLSPPCFSCKISPTAWWWQWLLTSRSLVTPSCDRGGILWLAKWCINGFILVHEYTFTFNCYVVIQHHTQIHIQRQFSVTNIYIFTVATYLHSHSRSKFLFNTVPIFIQQFVNVLKFTNSMFLHIERFNSFSRIHSFTFKGQKFYSTLLQYLFNILCAFFFTHSQASSLHYLWKQETHLGDLIWSAPVRRCLREEIRTFNGGAQVFWNEHGKNVFESTCMTPTVWPLFLFFSLHSFALTSISLRIFHFYKRSREALWTALWWLFLF